MNITVLMDNEAQNDLACEWGLSLLFDFEGTSLLLDAGATDAFAHNAQALGADLATVDAAVLSHAHFDHSGGMETFLRKNTTAPLFLAASAAANCWSDSKGPLNYIGVAPALFANHEHRLVRVSEKTQVAPGIWVLPHMTPDLEKEGAAQGMYVKQGEEFETDDFAHEVTLVFEQPNDVVACSGCSHAGAAAILGEVQQAFPGKPVSALVGGLHLYDRTPEEVAAFAQTLRQAGVEHVITGHCTGDAWELLTDELGPDHVSHLQSGATFTLP